MLIQLLQMPIINGMEIYTVTNQFNTVINSLQKGVLSDVISFGRAIGLFGAILTLLVYYQKCQISGDPIVLKELYHLFIIVIALSAFPFLTSTIDTSAGFLQSSVESSVKKIDNKNSIDFKLREIEKNNAKKDEKNISTGNIITQYVGDVTDGIEKSIQKIIISYLINLLSITLYIVTFIFNILFTIKKMILYVFGPFSIGLSTIPVYRKSGLNWLNAYFTLAVAQVLSSLFLILFDTMMNSFIQLMPDELGFSGIITLTVLLIIFALVIIGLIFSSEKLAGKLMALDTTSTAAGMAGSTLKGAAQTASKMITKI